MLKFLEKTFEKCLYRIKGYEYAPGGNFEVNGEIFYVYLRTNETHEPHFHVYKEKGKHLLKNINKNHFHTCVSITKPEYIDHGFINGKFNIDERKAFCDFLKSKPEHLNGRTRWEHIITLWDPVDKYNDIYVGDVIMPDYTKLL